MEGSQFVDGARVWLPSASLSWSAGTVLSCSGNELRAKRDSDGAEVVLDAQEAYLQNSQTVEDMTSLSFLNEPGVLWNLQERYGADHIYTYTGNILIAVNPFRPVPHLYGSAVVEAYRRVAKGQASPEREQLPPHVYATACAAYRGMMRDKAGQAILVTGESGAGKTETAKLIMACLTYLGSQNQRSASSESGAGAGTGGARQLISRNSMAATSMTGVEQKILESNPLLEAFGNAKTLRNHNSSRFGKYVEIFFDPLSGAVTGAAVRTYLLERSRVVAVNNPERSFHIFYQLVYGASPEERAAWRLPDSAAGFAYLARSSCFELPGQSNAEEYQHTRSAMTHIGLSQEQQEAVLRAVSAVLHLGNITFEHGCRGGGQEGAVVAEGGAKGGRPGGREALGAAAELLGVDPGSLADALTTKQIATPEGPITTPLAVQAACDARDSLAKVVYARLFDWLVAAVNAAVDEAHNTHTNGGPAAAGARGKQAEHLSIGLLDIYGFESFEINDLEQLCINLTNEKLQQHFNTHVFKWEQEEYKREGVDWSYVSFRDNADVLELLEGRMGLMDLLDETCRFPKATAEDLSHKYGSSSVMANSSRFTRLKRPLTAFSIEHYAGNVIYDTKNFLDKNKDYVVAEHQALLSRSTQALLRDLFPPEDDAPTANGHAQPANGATPTRGGAKSQFQFRSVSSQCRKQLAELMSALAQLQPHYVRCIKPNASGVAGAFDPSYSLQQLRCGGVLEAVRISCAGYAYKRPYAAFLEHFWQLCPEPVHALRRRSEESRRAGAANGCGNGAHAGAREQLQGSGNGGRLGLAEVLARCEVEELKGIAVQVLQAAGVGKERDAGAGAPPDYHAGHTKLFLRSHAAGALERQRVARLHGAAAVIQAQWKGRQVARWYQAMRAAVVKIQSHCRVFLARRELQRLRQERAATAIQRAWRAGLERRRFLRLRQAAALLQAAWRARTVRRNIEAIRQERAALVLQTAWRGAVVRREYLGVLAYWRAAVKIQAAWRAYSARQLYVQILPLHRAALAMQRVWRSCRSGAQRVERLRSALVDYWQRSKAAVVIQAAWRGKVARMRVRKLRLQQRRARFLAAFGAADAAASAATARSGNDPLRQQDSNRTPVMRSRGMYGSGGFSKGGTPCSAHSTPRTSLGVAGGPCSEAGDTSDVVRSDVAAQPDKDSRMRERLQVLNTFKVTPLLQYWQQQNAAVEAHKEAHRDRVTQRQPSGRRAAAAAAGPAGTPPIPPAYPSSSTRPSTADGVRRSRRGLESANSIGSPRGSLLSHRSDVGASPDTCRNHDDPSEATSSQRADVEVIHGGAGEQGTLSCETSYGVLLGGGTADGGLYGEQDGEDVPRGAIAVEVGAA